MTNRSELHVLYLIVAAIAIIIAGLSVQFLLAGGMSGIWVAPYLSAASNYTAGGDFKIALDQVNEFIALSGREQLSYRFNSIEDPLYYNHNPIGYVILIQIATTLFGFFVGDLQAILMLQLFIHIGICITILSWFQKNRLQFWLFLVLYALNPLILYFVVFNFYYFWQVLPSVGILIYLNKKNLFNHQLFRVIVSVVMALLLLTRPTLILIVLMLFVLMVYEDVIASVQKHYLRLALSIIPVLFLTIILFVPNDKSVYHTVFVGLGAYPNDYGITLSDTSAYNYFQNETGIEVDIDPGGNYYDPEITQRYNEIIKNEVTNLLKSNPLIFIRNSVINFGQAYFLGFRTGAPYLINIGFSLLGYMILGYFLVKGNNKIRMLLIAICGNSITFVLYYPPIQAYHYGSFILILFLFIEYVNQVQIDRRLRSHKVLS